MKEYLQKLKKKAEEKQIVEKMKNLTRKNGLHKENLRYDNEGRSFLIELRYSVGVQFIYFLKILL